MKLLNIDDLVVPKRAVKIGGYEHQIAEQSVGQLIESAKMSKAQRVEEDDTVARFEEFVGAVKRILPTCAEDTLRGLTVKQLVAIVDFANAPDEEAAKVATQEAADEKKAVVGA